MDIEGLCGLVLEVLKEAETAAVKFGQETGHACPLRCGDCCKMDKPEDSFLSALPAALWVVEHNSMDALTDFATKTPEGHCFFYEENSDKHCSVYSLRPLVCRLFNFAGKKDKYGVAQFRPCRRSSSPAMQKNAVPPVFSDYNLRLASLYPILGNERKPLNNAFHRAAGWILFYKQFDPFSPHYNNPGLKDRNS